MKKETITLLQHLIGREPDETDIKLFDLIAENVDAHERNHPVSFVLKLCRKSYEIGREEMRKELSKGKL